MEFEQFLGEFAKYMTLRLKLQGIAHQMTWQAVYLRAKKSLLSGLHGWELAAGQLGTYAQYESLALKAGLLERLPQGPPGWVRPTPPSP